MEFNENQINQKNQSEIEHTGKIYESEEKYKVLKKIALVTIILNIILMTAKIFIGITRR